MNKQPRFVICVTNGSYNQYDACFDKMLYVKILDKEIVDITKPIRSIMIMDHQY